MKRRGDEGEQRGKAQRGGAPSGCFQQEMSRRPAYGRGESAGERESGDRSPCIDAKDAAERGEGGIVKVRRHTDTEHYPDRKIADVVNGMRDQNQPEAAD